MHEPDDMALLREYAATNSEAAFAELVSRRVGFVYSAALRQVRDSHRAEEVTQAVFIILARKAGRLREGASVLGWLFKTTRFAALAQMRAAAKRQQREQEAQMQTLSEEQPVSDPVWEQLSPLLDEALAKLGEADRQAVLLRFFEKKSLVEVGSALGTEEDTARKRVSRALDKLRKHFSKRGVRSTAAIIAGAISANSVQAAPAVLANSVTLLAVGKGVTAGGSILTLIDGALKIMAWTKAKTAIVVGIGVLFAGGVTTLVVQGVATARVDQIAEVRAAAIPPDRYMRSDLQDATEKAALVKLRLETWPKERETELLRIKSRQQKNEAVDARTIDLKPHLNATLTNSLGAAIGVKDNHLIELPSGVNIYAGIPFDVQGAVQLDSTTMANARKHYPKEVDHIRIGQRCAKLHLLHSGQWDYPRNFGQTVARLVLHYADNSTRDIELVAGEHVFDFWMPLFRTGVDPRFLHTAPGTERAWAGSNPLVKRVWPDESVVLYKSTFDNPQPEVAVVSMDYVSTMTEVAPVLVGLTVE